MPIEIRRFGVGHRRPDGPPGTVGIEGRVIESRSSGLVSELAFGRNARIAPHTNPRSVYFLVIEGGGWVGVGDERSRVIAGEAVVWPPHVLHAAWTDGAPMRVILVELAEDPRELGPVVDAGGDVEGSSADGAERPTGVDVIAPPRAVSRGEGRLADRPVTPAPHGSGPEDTEGEPL